LADGPGRGSSAGSDPLSPGGTGAPPPERDRTDPLDPFATLKRYLRAFFPDFHYRYPDDFFFAALREEFPRADLLAEMRTFHAWCLDRSSARPMNDRLTFRKWVSNAQSRKTPPPS
jgi:hypothetical protein